MKNLLFAILVLFAFGKVSAQDEIDYKLARTGEYVYGVYLFIHSDPVNGYDYVGKIKKFDFTDYKEVEKVLKKAKKKYAFFDGIIFKKDFDHVELIKFKTKSESVAGFQVGDIVQYEAYGKLRKGEIVDIDQGRQKVTVKYTDENGNEKLDGVRFVELNRVN